MSAVIVLSVLSLIVSIVLAVLFIRIVWHQDKIDVLDTVKHKEEISRLSMKYDILQETFNEYKKAFPIKANYKNGMCVYIVVNKKPYLGTITEVRQISGGSIKYAIEYKCKGCNYPQTTIVEQNKVYISLAEAIDSEGLMSL